MLIDLIDIIENTVNSIDNTLTFKVNGDELLTCDTSYLSVGSFITIGSQDYEVINVEQNVKIVLNTTVVDQGETTAIITEPKFRHGTVARVNSELVNDLGKDESENYPLVFLLEELEIDYNINQVPYATSLIKLFFIDQTNYEDYTTSEHHNNTVKPLKSLVSKFIESLKNNSSIEGELVDNFTTNLHPLLAYTDRDGYTVNILNDDLSAIQLTIELPIKKSNKCCKN